ncbi:MAG: hypothetical protein RXR01_09760 [Thermoproteus sp.]
MSEKSIRELQLYLAAITLGALLGLAYNMLTCRAAAIGGIAVESCGCQAALVNNATLYYDCAGGGHIVIRFYNMTIVEEKSGILFLP